VEWQRADLSLPRILPYTRLLLNGERLAPNHLDEYYLWTAAGDMDLPLGFNSSGIATWGDEFPRTEDRQLVEGLGIADAPRGRRIGWEAHLRHRLLRAGMFTVTHSNLTYRKRTRFSHTLQARGKRHFQWRLEGGYDWRPQTPYGQAHISYRLDKSGSSSIGISARHQRRDWIFGVTFSLRPTFAIMDGKPFLLTKSRLNPEMGGLKGHVFLDRNGNGLHEKGERGIEGIEVVANTGQRMTTTKRGTFILHPRGLQRDVHVRLNPLTVPAFYDATNGAQWAEIKKGALTRVGLGLIILNSVTGIVFYPDPQDTTKTVKLGGVRVVARSSTGEVVQNSITSGDGRYYIGELKPGDYQIDIDAQTLRRGFSVVEKPEPVRLEPTNDSIDLRQINIRCRYVPPPEREDEEQEAPEKKIDYKKF